ncbi:unnamed protein product [Rodentolepis nana]|uniref:Chitin-binding type-2 domain-containing protein n=1 Tax=Rodentolepis nana TaxID=102285 RepID=A0A0R3TWM6_RODNA|nr:unnamed protein product [Rodentolepis nana]
MFIFLSHPLTFFYFDGPSLFYPSTFCYFDAPSLNPWTFCYFDEPSFCEGPSAFCYFDEPSHCKPFFYICESLFCSPPLILHL